MSLSLIAERIGIDRSTLYRWKDRSDKIYNSLQIGTAEATKIIENNLPSLCRERIIIKKKYKADKSGEMILQEIVEEHLPPSESAIIFWLKNRDSQNWKDKRSIENLYEGIKLVVEAPDELSV